MAKADKPKPNDKRKRADHDEYEYRPLHFSPRKAKSHIDAARREAIVRDAQSTAGRIKRMTICKKYDVSKSQFYKILKDGLPNPKSEKKPRYREGSRKKFPDHYCNAVKVFEDSSKTDGVKHHQKYSDIAALLGLSEGVSERTIQRSMKDFLSKQAGSEGLEEESTAGDDNDRLGL